MIQAAASPGEVLVGADGSDASLQAVDWAAAEAATRGSALVVCCVAAAGTDEKPVLWDGQELVLVPADDVVRQATARARSSSADLSVTGHVVRGDPAQQLLERSREARLLVVGARGLGGFIGLLVGSVSDRVAGRAACPVVVVRGHASREMPVLAGVDGSAANQTAVGFAFDAAARQGVGLVAMCAAEPHWIVPSLGSPASPVPDLDRAEEEARNRLEQGLQAWTDRYPDVPVRRVAIVKGAAKALIDESARAGLVVVGSRGYGTFSGAVLGSVSRPVLHHAECPVAVVRG
jgi:nucleotide-binding universal stress UspA family protein